MVLRGSYSSVVVDFPDRHGGEHAVPCGRLSICGAAGAQPARRRPNGVASAGKSGLLPISNERPADHTDANAKGGQCSRCCVESTSRACSHTRADPSRPHWPARPGGRPGFGRDSNQRTARSDRVSERERTPTMATTTWQRTQAKTGAPRPEERPGLPFGREVARRRRGRTAFAAEAVRLDLEAHQLLVGERASENLLEPDRVHPARRARGVRVRFVRWDSHAAHLIGCRSPLLEACALDRRSRAGRRLLNRAGRVGCGGSRSPHERRAGWRARLGEGA